MKKIMEISNITKNYQTIDKEINALENVSFNIYEGDFIAIVGPSGCGKSTLLSLISGLDSNYCGNINKLEEIKTGYMFQNDYLFPWLSIINNCRLSLDVEKNKNYEYIENLIYEYGLNSFKNAYPSDLSGGMRQRVALIRTLASKPDILLLDEPFSALDYQTREDVSNDVYKIIKNEKKTALIVTHDISEAISMANKVIVLSSRPGTIIKIYDINIPIENLPKDRKKDINFNKYYNSIWSDFNHDIK